MRNPDCVVDKVKDRSVINQKLNGFDLVRKIMKHGLNGIIDYILDVYKLEKDKLYKYLDKLPGHFNVTID